MATGNGIRRRMDGFGSMRETVKRPPGTLALAALAMIAAAMDAVIALQFAEVIPWGEDKLEYWGGRWVGALLFGGVALLSAAVGWGWLTLKPWAWTITVLLAGIGLSVPVTSLMAGTKTWSTAIGPIVIYTVVLVLVFMPDVRNATRPEET